MIAVEKDCFINKTLKTETIFPLDKHESNSCLRHYKVPNPFCFGQIKMVAGSYFLVAVSIL
jgi:hypothetical protein